VLGAVSRRRRALAGTGAVLLAGLASGIGTARAAGTPVALVSYRGAASADGLRVTLIRPDAPLASKLVDAGLPSASAAVGRIDGSTASSSSLFPGDLVLSLPGLLSGIVGTSLPRYPAIATATDPDVPEKRMTVGPIDLLSRSAPDTASGSASYEAGASGLGVGSLRATAEVTVDQDRATITATSTSQSSGLTIAGLLSIASVRSTATAKKVGSAAVSLSSETVIGAATVAGIPLEITPDGLTLPGQVLTLPDTSPLLAPLRDKGIDIRTVAERRLPQGIQAGGIEVEIYQEDPDGGSVTVTYRLGGALATLTATTEAPVVAVTPSVAPTSGPAVAPGTDTPGTGGSGVAPLLPAAPVAGGPLPTAPQPGAGLPPEVAAPQQFVDVAAPRILNVAFARLGGASCYLLLVLAGAVVLAAQHVLRRLGVVTR
jgi:hypothetical protein